MSNLDTLLGQDLKRELDEIADRTGRSRADLVREAVRELVGTYTEGKEGRHRRPVATEEQ